MYTYIYTHKVNSNAYIFELSKRSSYMLRQAFMARKRRRAWNVDTAVDKTQERRQRWWVKGWSVFVAVCINAQSDEQTVRPAETQFAGKSSKSRRLVARTEMECRPVSPFVVRPLRRS